MKRIKLHQMILAAISGAVLFTVPVGAETALDQAPEIKPVNPNGQKVLFDNTHAQTAGAADWVIDGAFSDFGNGLANAGYYVKELRKTTPITLEDLKSYDVFVLPEANVPYKVSEQDAIEAYVAEGGAVFYISDHYNADRNKNRIDSSEAFNGYRRGAFEDMTKDMSTAEKNSEAMQGVESSDWLSDTFGVRFRYNSLDKISDSSKWVLNDAFGILNGVQSVGLHAGSTVAITDPTRAKGLIYPPEGLTSSNKWGHAVDQGVYNNGGTEEGAYVAISKKEKGKAAFIGDSSPVEDSTPKYLREENGNRKRTYDGWKEKDDAKLLVNLVDWLAKKESYDTFDKVGIQLSSKTVLHDFEQPEKSTETQAEPWAAPSSSYKWYDTSTFAPGSFGSTSTGEVPSIGNVSIEVQENAQATRENKALVKVSGLEPNSKSEGYRLGVYTPIAQNGYTQGQQVAKTKIGENGQWSPVGYSEYFSVTADAKGNAEQEVFFNVEFEGDYNIRIKQGKENVITNNLTIVPYSDIEEPTDPDTGEGAGYDVKGEISFEKNDGAVKPVDPENPNQDVTPINPDGSEASSPAGGLLSVDYASSFGFGKQSIENKNMLYGAQPQQFKDSDALRGNYVQVSDRRGTNAGWVLSIIQNDQFKTAQNDVLTGAKLYFGNGTLNSPAMKEEGFDSELSPVNFVKDLSLASDKVTGGLELIPGQSSIIMSAGKGTGTGMWTLSYGQSKNDNIGLMNANDPAKSSVLLSVPSSASPVSASYESTLTYRLSMVPAP